ncbi:MAG: AMP-binding protein [Pseudomonadales bacterium]|nr:AMP-binding protein [Pseudomonadales bacterium]
MITTYIDTVTALMERNVARHCDDTAVIYGKQQMTYGALNQLSLKAARGLSNLGVKSGDRVAFWLPNTIAYIALYLACTRLGAIAVAVNTRYRSVEVSDIVRRSGAKLMVLWPGFRNIDFLEILSEIPEDALGQLETVILYDEGQVVNDVPSAIAAKNQLGYEELVAADPYDQDHSGPDVGCNIFTTSGTTKAPKFVLHRQTGIAQHAQDVWRNLEPLIVGEFEDGCFLQTLPLCGVFGFNHITAAIAGGRPTVLQNSFDAAEAVALIDTHKVRYFSATDDMIIAMLAADPREQAMPGLVCCAYGAFNMSADEVARRAHARGVKLVGLYGMSEVQALFARRDHTLPYDERYVPGGKLISDQAKVRTRNPETGELMGHGESGELELKGPSLMLEYFEDPDATSEAMTADGYLRSGDLGYTTSEDSFVFEARMGDTLRLGGYLVSPVEIESHLAEHPQVEAAQVVAVRVGEVMRPFAFVIPTTLGELDQEALGQYCKQGLARFKVPVAFLEINTFPTTESPNGTKIQRAKLRRLAEVAMAEQAAEGS